MLDPPLTIRFARRHRMLIAERDGTAIAGMALSSGAVDRRHRPRHRRARSGAAATSSCARAATSAPRGRCRPSDSPKSSPRNTP